MSIRENLEQVVSSWEHLNHPALFERFILRNGKEFTPGPLIGKLGKAKHCFENTATFVQENPSFSYVEGYCLNKKIQLPFLHSWATRDGKWAMDPTLENPTQYEYYGVIIEREKLLRTMLKTGVYGVLDPGIPNLDFMFEYDPELKTIFEEIRSRKKVRSA